MNFEEIKREFEKIEVLPECLNTTFGFISDVKKFVNSHIAVLEAHPKNKYFIPFFNRLKEVYLLCLATRQLRR